MLPQSLLKIQHPPACCGVAVEGLMGECVGLRNFEIILFVMSSLLVKPNLANSIQVFSVVTENYFELYLLLDRKMFQVYQFVKFSSVRIVHCYF